MVDKNSQGHVEMILSLVLFIGFLIFVFVFLNIPIKTKHPSIRETQEVILENISSKTGKLSVVLRKEDSVNGIPKGSCYNFNESQYLKVGEKYFEKNNGERTYIIYFSETFDENYAPTKRSDCDSGEYKLGSYTREDIVFYSKIKTLKESYELNYISLKDSLGIEDFSFSFKDINGVEISELNVEGKIPKNVDVLSKDILLRVMDSKGTIGNKGEIYEYILNIKKW